MVEQSAAAKPAAGLSSTRAWGLSVIALSAFAGLFPLAHASLKCGCVLRCSDASCDADSFPLSTFPMFAGNRARVSMAALRGRTADGQSVPIPPNLLGTSEVMQARATLQIAANSGKKAGRVLCKQVAEVVASEARHDVVYRGIKRLELTIDEYDPVAYFTTSREPLSAQLVADCHVPSTGAE